jgi:hypothetical protein
MSSGKLINATNIVDMAGTPHLSSTAVAALLGSLATAPCLYDGPEHKVHVINGETTIIEKSPPVRDYNVDAVDALIGLAEEASVVWHQGDVVRLIIDPRRQNHPAGKAEWYLETTEAWAKATAQELYRSQKDVIRLLSVHLRKALKESPTAQALLDAVRVMTFNRGETTRGEVAAGRSSMGKEITASAAGVTELPEWIQVAPQRWSQFPELTISMELLVDVDPTAGTFEVRPTEDEVVTCERQAQQWLGKMLREKFDAAGKQHVLIFQGHGPV